MLKWMMHWTGRSLLVNQPDDFDQSRDLDCSNSPNMYRSMYVSPYTPCTYTYIYIYMYSYIHTYTHADTCVCMGSCDFFKAFSCATFGGRLRERALELR